MDVSANLEAQKSKYPSINVEKPIPLQFDLGLLAAFDTNAVDEAELKKDENTYLKKCTRDNTQLLINQLFKLPVDSSQNVGLLIELPDPVTAIPREKPLPKSKPLTRWEKFAKAKGIQHRRKDRKIFDEASGEWVSRWGYKGVNDDGANDWLIPVPDNSDPYEDQFAKMREAKRERILKNEKRHRRNVEEAQTTLQPSNNKSDARTARKLELQQQIVTSKTATASYGRFDKPLDGDSKMKGKKGKFEPNVGDVKKEKETSINILNNIVGKKVEALNVRKAIARR
ncbi:14528_t:CDS:2 [Acaulospora morrowiae]|uniref:Ribosome biogenesis regulatory protein n=1 Tax=Acaulospora morrowiae TaxID=94023 RepID=A0A9N8ZIS3_9GLOM|nr:14528_t:CDS:2 [Acaulospora morrowiae]